jgi:hypothetical protein
MEVTYWLYKDEFEAHIGFVDKKEPVELEVMDQAEKVWKKAKVLLFQKSSEGSSAVGLLGPFGELGDEGKYHIKVLEIIPSPLDDDE